MQEIYACRYQLHELETHMYTFLCFKFTFIGFPQHTSCGLSTEMSLLLRWLPGLSIGLIDDLIDIPCLAFNFFSLWGSNLLWAAAW